MTARVTDPDHPPICGARKRNGEQCRAKPITGGTRCGKHGGAAPQVQAKARERVIEQNARGILGRIDPEAPVENPVETLIKLIQAKSAEVGWLRSKVQELDENELTWGLIEHREGQGPEGPIDVQTRRAEQNIWWKLLREAENQLASWAAMAIKAGVEERRIRLEESQGQLVSQVIRTILDALNLTPTQAQLVPTIVPQALRQLSGEGS